MSAHLVRCIVAVLAIGAAGCGADADPDTEAASAADTTSPTGTGPTGDASAPMVSATAPAAVPPATVPPTPAPAPPTTEFPAAPRVLLVGDSTLLAVQEYEVLDVLRGMDPVYEARSCRALGQPSCGTNPAPNSVAVIDGAEGAFDMVVVMAGYDEWYTTFADSFDQVVASSRAKGTKRIVWLTYPEGVDYELPDGTPGNESLVNINQIMRDKVASGAFPDVVVADWFHYATAAQGWFAGDDIHLTPTGAHGVADYISRKVAAIAALPCPMPREPGGAVEAPCPDPDATGPVIDVVALYAAA